MATPWSIDSPHHRPGGLAVAPLGNPGLDPGSGVDVTGFMTSDPPMATSAQPTSLRFQRDRGTDQRLRQTSQGVGLAALERHDDKEVKRSMPMPGQVFPRATGSDPAETLASTLVSRLRPGTSHVRARVR